MNVLFDDGSTVDRKLKYLNTDPIDKGAGSESYDPYSEAFQFFKPIDKIWGNFRKRKLQELTFALEKEGKGKSFEEAKTAFKQNYYLRRIINIEKIAGKKEINWKDVQTETVDIATLFPPKTKLFEDKAVIGVAFGIYRREVLSGAGPEKTFAYYLDVRPVVNGEVSKKTLKTLEKLKVKAVQLAVIIKEKWDPDQDLLLPEDDGESLHRIGPTLVLNKETLLKNPNYTGDWSKVEESSVEKTPKMVVRIGRDCSTYVLFLHGEQESGCPIRIPQDE